MVEINTEWETTDLDLAIYGSGYIFSSNVTDVFDGEDLFEGAIAYHAMPGFIEKYNQLQFDAGKEQQALYELEKYSQKKLPTGISEMRYGIDNNHMIWYKVQYLIISWDMREDFMKLDDALWDSYRNYDREIYNTVFKDATYVYPGPLGGAEDCETVLLTEELCTKFNLNCSRW